MFPLWRAPASGLLPPSGGPVVFGLAALSVRSTLRALFAGMLLIIVGVLASPIYSDRQQLAESKRISRIGHAGSFVFSALQNLRLERGPTRMNLEFKDPASSD